MNAISDRVKRLPEQWRQAAVPVLIALLVFWPLQNQVQAAAGDLDLTFGAGGKVTTSFFDVGEEAHALAIQPDGKIVAAGYAFTPVLQSDFALARYNADGALDSSFGVGGKVTTDFFGFFDQAFAVTIQPDGKIVAAGSASLDIRHVGFGMARYNSDGSLDASFGSGGKVITQFFGEGDGASAIAVLPGGKLLAAGSAFHPGMLSDFALARYNSDGSLDLSFGSGGKITTDFGGRDDLATSLVIQPGGKIVVAGSSGVLAPAIDFALARYNPDGSLDTSFGTAGRVVTDFTSSNDQARGVALQPDGKIIAAGMAGVGSGRVGFGLARYDSNGSLDSSFGAGGKVTTDFGCGAGGFAVLTQPDGKIIVSGSASLICFPNPGSDFALARYHSDGVLDSSFGVGGKILSDFSGSIDTAYATAIQPDGKIVACGVSFTPIVNNLMPNFALARYNGDSFDMCLQDDSAGAWLQFNSTSGNYVFANCAGLSIGGFGTLTKRGGAVTLQDFSADRKVVAKIDSTVNKGSAGIQIYSQGTTFTISDRNTTNNTCTCR